MTSQNKATEGATYWKIVEADVADDAITGVETTDMGQVQREIDLGLLYKAEYEEYKVPSTGAPNQVEQWKSSKESWNKALSYLGYPYGLETGGFPVPTQELTTHKIAGLPSIHYQRSGGKDKFYRYAITDSTILSSTRNSLLIRNEAKYLDIEWPSTFDTKFSTPPRYFELLSGVETHLTTQGYDSRVRGAKQQLELFAGAILTKLEAKSDEKVPTKTMCWCLAQHHLTVIDSKVYHILNYSAFRKKEFVKKLVERYSYTQGETKTDVGGMKVCTVKFTWVKENFSGPSEKKVKREDYRSFKDVPTDYVKRIRDQVRTWEFKNQTSTLESLYSYKWRANKALADNIVLDHTGKWSWRYTPPPFAADGGQKAADLMALSRAHFKADVNTPFLDTGLSIGWNICLNALRMELGKCPFSTNSPSVDEACYVWGYKKTSYNRSGVTHYEEIDQSSFNILKLLKVYGESLLDPDTYRTYKGLWTNVCTHKQHRGPQQGMPTFGQYLLQNVEYNTRMFRTKCRSEEKKTKEGGGCMVKTIKKPPQGTNAYGDEQTYMDWNIAQYLTFRLPPGKYLLALRPGLGKTITAIQMVLDQWKQDTADRAPRAYLIVVPGAHLVKPFEDQFDELVNAMEENPESRPTRYRALLYPFRNMSAIPREVRGNVDDNPVLFLTYADLRQLVSLLNCMDENTLTNYINGTLLKKCPVLAAIVTQTGVNKKIDASKLFIVCDEAHNLFHKLGSPGLMELELTSLQAGDPDVSAFSSLQSTGICARIEPLAKMRDFIGTAGMVLLLTATPVSIDDVTDKGSALTLLTKSFEKLIPGLTHDQYLIAGLGAPSGKLLVNQLRFKFTEAGGMTFPTVTLTERLKAEFQNSTASMTDKEKVHNVAVGTKLTGRHELYAIFAQHGVGPFATNMSKVLKVGAYIDEVFAEISQKVNIDRKRVVVYFSSQEPCGRTLLFNKCRQAGITCFVSSKGSPELNFPVKNERAFTANRESFNECTVPAVLFYDFFGQTTSVDIYQVHVSIFISLPQTPKGINASDFVQTLGRGNRYAHVPPNATLMEIIIFEGSWMRQRCCELFNQIVAYQEMFENVPNVTEEEKDFMGKMYAPKTDDASFCER